MNQKRIHDYGITIGSYPAGPRNAITDIEGVKLQMTINKKSTCQTQQVLFSLHNHHN